MSEASGSSSAAAMSKVKSVVVAMIGSYAGRSSRSRFGSRGTTIEFVRREVRLGSTFAIDAFARAFAAFYAQYSLPPDRGVCAPDVFARVAELFAGTAAAAHQHSTRVMFEGVPIVVGIVAPGTIVFEGNVDETKMGDW